MACQSSICLIYMFKSKFQLTAPIFHCQEALQLIYNVHAMNAGIDYFLLVRSPSLLSLHGESANEWISVHESTF